MDLAGATVVGLLIGSIVSLVISVVQRNADRHARAIERAYERMHAASRLIRISMWQAAQLNFSRTLTGKVVDAVSGGPLTPNWQPFAYTITEVGAALALILKEIAGANLTEYEAATEAILKAKGSDRALLSGYVKAGLALRRELEAKARALR